MARYKLLTEKELSEWLSVPEATLKTQRFRPPKDVPAIPFIKLPNGSIRYREDHVLLYLEQLSELRTPPTRPSRRAG